MFLRNFYCALAYAFNVSGLNLKGKYVDGTEITGGFSDSNIQFFRVAAQSSIVPSFEAVRTSASSGSTHYAGVIFGDGDVPVTVNDFKLSGNIITTISGTGERTFLFENNKVKGKSLLTITNTGNETITIREVALMCATSSTSNSKKMIIERTVLDAPVVIPAGGIGMVEYNIYVDIPALPAEVTP